MEDLRADDKVIAINDLCQIHGIGPKKASELLNTYGIKSIADLRKQQDLLNSQQKIGLKYFEDMQKRYQK